MKRRRLNVLHLLPGICLSAAVPSVQAQAEAEVGVHAEHRGGDVVYRYRLVNRGALPVHAFRLGCECFGGGARLGQLSSLPVNAWAVREDVRGVRYALAEAVGAPSGWRVRALRPHGSPGYWIEWYASSPQAGVAPGGVLDGFSVELAQPDPAFLEGDVSIAGAPAQRLRLLDLEPPRLSLATQSARPAPGAASIRIVADVRDDRDPAPRVTLETVEPAPGAPPAWIVTYVAEDASGNRARARVRVVRPRPGGEEAGSPGGAGTGDAEAPTLPSLLRLVRMP